MALRHVSRLECHQRDYWVVMAQELRTCVKSGKQGQQLAIKSDTMGLGKGKSGFRPPSVADEQVRKGSREVQAEAGTGG